MADKNRKTYAENQAEAEANQSVYEKLYNRAQELEKELYYNDDKNAVIPDAKAKRAELDKIESQMKDVGPTSYRKRLNGPDISGMLGIKKAYAKGGAVKKAKPKCMARGGGCEVRGKTKGRFV